jgi:hypothetical protein
LVYPLLLTPVLTAAGCGGDDRKPAISESEATGVPSGSSDASSGDDSSDNGEDKLDVGDGSGTGAAGEGGGGDGCEKVDFLFVIDSSGSMQDEQQNLLTSFPGFITAIEQTLEFNDFQLMVVDAGQTLGSGCDGTLGAGRVTSGSGQDCGIEGGKRFATQAQSNLAAAFSCIGSRGFEGPGDEQTMDSLTAALGPLSQSGQCNEGFLRDDAVLVVTIITDEEDDPGDGSLNPPLDGSCAPADDDPNSAGDPGQWYDAVVAAKNGDPNAVVVLSLLGDCDTDATCPGIEIDPFNPAAPITGAEPAPRLRQFTNMFDYGSTGPVCASDYSPFFESAISIIANACDNFVPPG